MNATAPAKRAPQQWAADRLLRRAGNPLLRQPRPAGATSPAGDPWLDAELLGQDAFWSGLPEQNPFPDHGNELALSLRERWAAGWNAAEKEFWRGWRLRPQPGATRFHDWAERNYPKVAERLQREAETPAQPFPRLRPPSGSTCRTIPR